MDLKTVLRIVEDSLPSFESQVDLVKLEKTEMDQLVSDFYEYYTDENGEVSRAELRNFINLVASEVKSKIEYEPLHDIKDQLEHAQNIEDCFK